MYCNIARPKKMGYLQTCKFTMERFQAKVLTISGANHSTPQLPASVADFLLPPSTEDDIKFPKTQGCHVAMHLTSCHRLSTVNLP